MNTPHQGPKNLRQLLDDNDLAPEEQSDYRELIANYHRITNRWKDNNADWRIFHGPSSTPRNNA